MKKKSSRARDRRDVRRDVVEIDTPDKYFEQADQVRRIIKTKQFPWTERQKEFFKIALDKNTKIIFIDGPAGSSKTMLSVYCGLQLLNSGDVSELMYLRSAVESSESRLGFLPGAADEKLHFYNLPFLDKLDELLEYPKTAKLQSDGVVSMFPVNFARGMNWRAKCIIMDEVQNSSYKEIVTVLTRLGENSKCFVLADPMQTDLRGSVGGFEKLCHVFDDDESRDKGIRVFRFTEEDVMRSALCRFIVTKLKSIR